MKTSDIKLIADALALNMEDCRTHGYDNAGAIGAAIAIADSLVHDDANFNKQSFLLAAGAVEKTYPVLWIDAWRDGDGGWQWNEWRERCTVPAHVVDLKPRALLAYMRKHTSIFLQPGDIAIEDDGHNIVFCSRGTRQPLFAIEYGSAI